MTRMEAKQKDNDTGDGPRLLNVERVAKIVGLTAWGVKHLHRAGKLRGVVQSGKLFWFREDVDGYLERLRDDAA